jgi:hypothetical protein
MEDLLINISNMCSCSVAEAEQYLKSEIKNGKENLAAGDDLFTVVSEICSGLGIEADYEMQIAEMLSF